MPSLQHEENGWWVQGHLLAEAQDQNYLFYITKNRKEGKYRTYDRRYTRTTVPESHNTDEPRIHDRRCKRTKVPDLSTHCETNR